MHLFSTVHFFVDLSIYGNVRPCRDWSGIVRPPAKCTGNLTPSISHLRGKDLKQCRISRSEAVESKCF